ncbi:MAG TPA: aminotransferase class V-fold PLP-dependent enzyme [Ktedonobacterales bacterium]
MSTPRDTADEPLAEAGRHFLLRPDIIFLNHGSFGACPAPVFATYQQWQRTLEEQPVEFLGRRHRALLMEAGDSLARYLGARREDLAFVPNATHGMNIVAHSLVPTLAPGDEVLGTDHEYGAVERTWTLLCDQRGAHYRTQAIALPVSTHEALVEQLWAGVTARTRIIVVSHITSPTALTFPIERICRRASAQGILTVVDGAHAPGQLDLALDALGADYYMGNLHKWVCAPKGAAFLYARPERQAALQPLVVSWGWRSRDPGISPFQDYFEWIGTDDPAAYLSVPAAIAFQAQYNWPAVRAACHALAVRAAERIAALTGLPPVSPATTDWWVQMCAIPLPTTGLSAEELKRRLWEDYQIEVPIVEWQERRFVRISIQAYTRPRDVDRLVEALAELLGRST